MFTTRATLPSRSRIFPANSSNSFASTKNRVPQSGKTLNSIQRNISEYAVFVFLFYSLFLGGVALIFCSKIVFYANVSSSWYGTTTTPAAAIMRVTETGWDSESVQEWYVKYTGKYQNDLVWAGDYKLDYSKFNVYNECNEKSAKQD